MDARIIHQYANPMNNDINFAATCLFRATT